MYIYVAGPYTGGNPGTNVRRAITAGHALISMGHTPYVPHAYHFWDLFGEQSYEECMQQCFAWVRKCEALLRLPGDSPGADREVAMAIELDIPVYHSVDDIPLADLLVPSAGGSQSGSIDN